MRHRPPGRGHVYRRGRVWWISLWVNGRRHQESSRSTVKGDAVRLLAERVALLAPGADRGNTRLLDLCGMIVSDYEVNGRRSTARLRVSLNHLLRHFGDGCLARSIDEASLVEYTRTRIGEGAGAGTVNGELAALRRAFRIALDIHKVVRVPRFRLLIPPPARSGFVESGDLQRFVKHLPRHVAPVVVVAAATGWRLKSELLTRGWEHLDLEAGWLRLEPGEGKTGKGRMFPLTAELKALLREQRRRAERISPRPRTVFFHPSGRPIKSIRRAWVKARREAGLPRLTPHDLRRTAVRNMERAGVPRSSAMQLVGHRSHHIYDRYAITDEAMLREAAVKLERRRTGREGRARR